MALLKTDEKSIEIEDNSQIKDAAEELGVLFGCRNGMCGACQVNVIEGMDNLTKINEAEKMLCDGNQRLCCQVIIKKGEVKIQI